METEKNKIKPIDQTEVKLQSPTNFDIENQKNINSRTENCKTESHDNVKTDETSKHTDSIYDANSKEHHIKQNQSIINDKGKKEEKISNYDMTEDKMMKINKLQTLRLAIQTLQTVTAICQDERKTNYKKFDIFQLQDEFENMIIQTYKDQSIHDLKTLRTLVKVTRNDILDEFKNMMNGLPNTSWESIGRKKGKSNKQKTNGCVQHSMLYSMTKAINPAFAGSKILSQVLITLDLLRDSLGELGVKSQYRSPPSYLWMSDSELIMSKLREVDESVDVVGYEPSDSYTERLHTFLQGNNPHGTVWNNEQTVKPEQLVSAGFSFDGIQDMVRCKLCDCTSDVSKWPRNDEDYALSVHKELGKNCEFVRSYGVSSSSENNATDIDCFLQTVSITYGICEIISNKAYSQADSSGNSSRSTVDCIQVFKEISFRKKMLIRIRKLQYLIKSCWRQNFSKQNF